MDRVMTRMTFSMKHKQWKPDESVATIALPIPDENFIMFNEEQWPDGTTNRQCYMVGPVPDRLFAYENTGMEPDDIKQMEEDLACAEERENVKEVLIIKLREEIKVLENKVAFLNGMCSGAEVLKKENEQLKDELKRHNNVCRELDTKLEFANACNKAAELETAMLRRKLDKYEIMRQTLQAATGFEIKI